MKVEQLICFDAVVSQGSFRSAATFLHKTQPALSKAIQTLEDQLGFILLDRNEYRPVLTEKGRIFHQSLQKLLSSYDKLTTLSTHLRQQYEPYYCIAIDMACPLEIVVPTLQDLFVQFPNTQFNVVTTAINGGNELLLDDEVNLAINEHLYLDNDLEVQPLTSVDLIPVASPQFVAENAALLADPHKIAELLQIVVADSAKNKKFTFGVVSGSRQWLVTDIYNKHALIKRHLGWGRLPDHLVAADIQSGELISLDYEHIKTRRLELSMIRKRQYQQGVVASAIWDSMCAHASNLFA